MSKNTPIALEVNCETGEVVERPLTAEEIADRTALAEQAAQEQAAREEEAAQKETDRLAGIAALKALGLTDAQITALVG
jgi:Holliday junction resolvasome RuvABC DNA-binding subunit